MITGVFKKIIILLVQL